METLSELASVWLDVWCIDLHLVTEQWVFEGSAALTCSVFLLWSRLAQICRGLSSVVSSSGSALPWCPEWRFCWCSGGRWPGSPLSCKTKSDQSSAQRAGGGADQKSKVCTEMWPGLLPKGGRPCPRGREERLHARASWTKTWAASHSSLPGGLKDKHSRLLVGALQQVFFFVFVFVNLL